MCCCTQVHIKDTPQLVLLTEFILLPPYYYISCTIPRFQTGLALKQGTLSGCNIFTTTAATILQCEQSYYTLYTLWFENLTQPANSQVHVISYLIHCTNALQWNLSIRDIYMFLIPRCPQFRTYTTVLHWDT